MRTRTFTIDRCLTDKRLLGAELGDAATWQTWRVALKAAFGQLLSPEEREVFTAIAGNRGLPKQRVREFWCVVGRRGGKSRMAAALGVHSALFVKHRLARGERGLVLILAASKEQAGVVFDYAEAFLQSSAALRKEIVSATRSEIRLRSGITIAVHSNSFRTIRGRTLCAAIFDETAFWRDETSLMPDIETYTAVLPGLATTNGMLIGISTPYRKLGLLYQKHRDHFGVDGDDVLVVQGSSLTFNSATLSDAAVAAQRAADPTAADAEWDAIFRTDIGAFLDDELIDRAIDYGRPLELPPQDGVVYRAFVDSSGGAVGGDAYALGIGHLEGENYVTDVVRGRSGPFDPQEVTKEYAQLCRDYHVGRITGDNYGKEWVADAWRQVGFEYVKSPLPKDEIYLECLPVFTRGLVRLPNHARLVRELRLLERHTHRSGKDTVTHPRNGHDDYANVVCGVINLMVRTARAASQELNFHPPFVAGTPRHVPGGSALEYSTSALDAVTSPAGAGAPVAPREDFRNYADGVYLGPGHKWWGPV